MQGILLVDKPAGWTSFDVVNYVRQIARQTAQVESYQVYKVESDRSQLSFKNFKDFQLSTPLPKVKVGHTGTLDPFATGLLIVLVGKGYTRRAGEFSKLDKTYEVIMKLGETSSTGDPEGEVTPYQLVIPGLTRNPESKQQLSGSRLPQSESRTGSDRDDNNPPSEAEILSVFRQFEGKIEQVPPAYSAIKVNGQRAYKLARAGKEVVMEPRPVTIHRLELVSYDYPELKLVAEVSSGTYIRSLVEDIGQALGTGAYTTALRRTAIGEYAVQNACQVTDLDSAFLIQSLREQP